MKKVNNKLFSIDMYIYNIYKYIYIITEKLGVDVQFCFNLFTNNNNNNSGDNCIHFSHIFLNNNSYTL